VIENRGGAMLVIATLVRVLRDHGRPLFEDDITDAFLRHHVEPDEVRMALRTMLETGMVRRPAPGWWSAP
jgi:hypothetical protein